MRANPVKAALKAGKPSVGTWLSLGSITASRFLARCGFAWLTIDIEHSLVDWETASHMFGCIADAGCTALARVPANRHDHIKRVLDNGAHGVVVPMVNTRQEAEAAVAAMLYPPHGNRSLGGSVHALNFQASPADYYAKANNEILIVLQCEHPMAIDNAEQVYSVPGIDAVFIGPNDLAANMRTPDGKNPSAEEQAEAHRRLLAACKKIGVPAGIHCYSAEEAKKRIEEGWQFLAVGSELRMMMDSAGAIIRNIGLNAQGELARY
ncbi:MAG: 2-dehydro-3-deoxyglucarate aldolase [Planctomycetia bacterium]|nr:2-dehydro-3-deoxyglucarate aldolase [Planctomycetia bacterium]